MALVIGIPKEIKSLEKRVGLTPQGVQQLSLAGCKTLVQRGAGETSSFSDDSYEKAGAVLVNTAAELYDNAQIILKVKEPLPSEFTYLRPGLVLFSFLHLAAPTACDLVRALMSRGVTALAFETLEKEGRRPLLSPMSEIAGALASLFAGYFLKQDLLKPGVVGNECESSVARFSLNEDLEKIGSKYPELIPGISSPAQTVIFGGGIAGEAAARYALRLGGSVVIVEKNRPRCAQLTEIFKLEEGRFAVFTQEQLPQNLLKSSDVWIGAVHQTGKRALQVVDKSLMEEMCRGTPKIIMDISIDQGGNFPEALPTSYEIPFYRDSWANVRFGVPNVPSLAGRYASERLTSLVVPYTKALTAGYEAALKIYPELKTALNAAEGKILLDCVRDAHGL